MVLQVPIIAPQPASSPCPSLPHPLPLPILAVLLLTPTLVALQAREQTLGAAAKASLHRLRHQAEKQREFSGGQQQQLKQTGQPSSQAARGKAKKAAGQSQQSPPKGSRSGRSPGAPPAGAGSSSSGGRGSSKAASQSSGGGGEEGGVSFQCPICLDDTAEGRLCVTTCGHTFCTECIHGLVDKSWGGKCECGFRGGGGELKLWATGAGKPRSPLLSLTTYRPLPHQPPESGQGRPDGRLPSFSPCP